ncbi:MAG: AAA family ATPase [Candidatus Riflebacteria bacterium]|nr:AAA family ATPase [Candidatus Riflebacteria bacterium]
MIDRDLRTVVAADLARYDKMIFIAGPRQSGKTTLARTLMAEASASRYWNHDLPEDRVLLARNAWFFREIDRARGTKPLVVLDELHKLPRWKSYLWSMGRSRCCWSRPSSTRRSRPRR